jgi:feruloyl esterase
MIMSQRYPSYFDGIVSGDPAIRTGHSNLALAYFASTLYSVSPRLSDTDKKLVVDSVVNTCDERDGLKDGMIFNSRACTFNPTALTCSGAKTDSCLSAQQAAGLQKAFAGPKDSRGNPVYPAFPFDGGIMDPARLPGILRSEGSSPVNRPPSSAEFDVDKAAWNLAIDAAGRLGDSTWTNLSTFSGNGGKLIFYHGMSDPWFSPLDTLGYYEAMRKENGGVEKVKTWSRLFLVPGMGHCSGGTATVESFDMLSAIVDWVENGKAPDQIIAKSRTTPNRSRPLCPYPAYAQYSGSGDPEDARNFACRE